MPDFYVGQRVKAPCSFGKEKRDNATTIRKGVITWIHSENRHILIDFGPYSESVYPNEILPLN